MAAAKTVKWSKFGQNLTEDGGDAHLSQIQSMNSNNS